MFPHQETWTSFKYLGMPIFLTNPTTFSWKNVLEKIRKKFAQWGEKWLNLVG
jgi:hypothetical protein